MVTKANVIAAIIGASVVGLAWVLTSYFAPGVTIVRGDFRVRHTVVTSTGTSGGEGGGITAIEFHPHYIVLKDRMNGGSVVFLERTHDFSWRVDKHEAPRPVKEVEE